MDASIKLVMFDLDGTLIETGNEICLALNETLGLFNYAPVAQHQVHGWIGRGTLELLIQALAFSSQQSEQRIRSSAQLTQARQQFERSYESHCGTVSQLYPRVREVLDVLKAQGMQLAVVTNKEIRYTKSILAAHQLTSLFGLVVGGDSVPAKKPDPAGICQCLDFFWLTSDQALFIGDSSIDAATARNAGVAVWLLPYGYNMNQNVHSCAPDRVIDDFSALLS